MILKYFKIMMLFFIVPIVIAAGMWVVKLWTQDFNCSGKLISRIQDNLCHKNSVADIFLSMNTNGHGYLLTSGTWSCKNSPEHYENVMQEITFRKQGKYYTVEFIGQRPHLDLLVKALGYTALKIKITRVNSGNYILTLPNEMLMVCTRV